jgi:hypothetical protein
MGRAALDIASLRELYRGKLVWFAIAAAFFLSLDLMNVSRPNVYATTTVDLAGSQLQHQAKGHVDYQYGALALPFFFEDGYPLTYRVPFETTALLPSGAEWDVRPAALEASAKNEAEHGHWVINWPAIVVKWGGIFWMVCFMTWVFSLMAKPAPSGR